MTNLCSKVRDRANPYEVWVYEDWTWRVLKKYQNPEREAQNPAARWFCFVTSNGCPDGEYGDVYVTRITGFARRLS